MIPTKSAIAAALGVDRSMATRWARQGMPLYSIEAARAWRLQNVRPRQPAAPRPSPGRLLALVRELGDTVDPGEIETLRAALALLPREMHARISLSLETWKALLGDELIAAIDAAPPGPPLTDTEAADVGALLVDAAIDAFRIR
jgi:hypothetical protein